MIDFKYSYFSPLLLGWKLSQAFVDAYLIYLGIVFDPSSGQNLKELEKIVRTRLQTMFDERFRHEDFVNALSDTLLYSQILQSTLALAKYIRIFRIYFRSGIIL
jgi:hypothetical protein